MLGTGTGTGSARVGGRTGIEEAGYAHARRRLRDVAPTAGAGGPAGRTG
jgi:hypothetical protein